MGPLKTTDLVGLDVRLAIAETLAAELPSDRFAPPEILRTLVAEGKIGRKSGEGFYRWEGDKAVGPGARAAGAREEAMNTPDRRGLNLGDRADGARASSSCCAASCT